MKIARRFRFAFDCALRVTHIALWMTIPTTVWLWLVKAEPPVDRCMYHCCSFCHENVLGVSFFLYLFIVLGLFLLGILVGVCWVGGYCVNIVRRVLEGDEALPPVRLSVIGNGYSLFWSSLGYWLPAIAYVLCNKAASHVLPHEAALQAFDTVMLLSSPLMPFMLLGYLVGVARYAAIKDRAVFCQRRENICLALSHFRATLALTAVLTMLPMLSAHAWKRLSDVLAGWQELDLMVEAALGSFAFYFVLLTCIIACSHLIARYARKIGIGDHLNPGAALD